MLLYNISMIMFGESTYIIKLLYIISIIMFDKLTYVIPICRFCQ